MKLNPGLQSVAMFLLAVTIQVLATLLIAGCIQAYFIDLRTLAESPEAPDLDTFNFFSRAIIESAIQSTESSGNTSPTAVIDSASSTIFLLGGISTFASIGAFLMLIFNFKNQADIERE